MGTYSVDSRRVTQLVRNEDQQNDLSTVLAQHLTESIHVEQDGKHCTLTHTEPLPAAIGQIRLLLRYGCAQPLASVPATIEIAAFRAISPTHVHYARVEQPWGSIHESVLSTQNLAHFLDRQSASAPQGGILEIGGSPRATPQNITGFIGLGLVHVLSGPDHLAFLLALVLLAGTLRRAILAATGFTVGHSITLALVALGWLHPDGRAIEALIGFTIMFTALEAARSQGKGDVALIIVLAAGIAALPWLAQWTGFITPAVPVYLGAAVFILGFGLAHPSAHGWMAPLLAASFGLVHGAGFAGGLIDLDLPRSRLVGALLGFNIGVEIAQLIALASFFLVARSARFVPQRQAQRITHGLYAALIGLGCYWCVGRSLLL